MKPKLLKQKINIFTLLIVLIFILLAGRLVYLQVIQVEKYQTLSKQNHIRIISIPPPRGEIFARDGSTKIVSNQPVYTVSLVYLGLENTKGIINQLAAILNIEAREIQQKFEQKQFRLHQPVEILSNVPLETVLDIEQRRLELPGVRIDVEPVREYPLGNIAAHVVGYVRQITACQLAQFREKGYRLGDDFGQTGLEYWYEEYLRGTPGARQVEVDAQARLVRELGIAKPVPGNGLVLTIDHVVQQAAEAALQAQLKLLQEDEYPDAKAGALVAIDVHTGGIIALASYPTFDPAVFTRPITPAEFDQLYDPKAKRFLNRALSAYPPGSVFKMVVAAAGLETGIIDPDYRMATRGHFFIQDTRINDWKPGGHGIVDLRKAIQESVNSYFCHFGVKIGQEIMAKYTEQFGLGIILGLDLPGEQKGVLPTPQKKFELFKRHLTPERREKLKKLEAEYQQLIAAAVTEAERRKLSSRLINERANLGQAAIMWELNWQAYDTPLMAIGQGISKYTPLQMAAHTAVIANGGTLYRPHLVQRIIDHQGDLVRKISPEVINRVAVSPVNLAIIRQGMDAVTQPGGTAYPIFNNLPVPVAAKTGTAEIINEDNHGLIVVYAPADDPQIAVAVIVEHGGSGSSGAGPVARDVLAAYFADQVLINKGFD